MEEHQTEEAEARDSAELYELLLDQGFLKINPEYHSPIVAYALAAYMNAQTDVVYECDGSDFIKLDEPNLNQGERLERATMIGLCRITLNDKTEYYCAHAEAHFTEEGLHPDLPKYFGLSDFLERARESGGYKDVVSIFDNMPRTEVTPIVPRGDPDSPKPN